MFTYDHAMAFHAGIIGASGFTGAELMRLLAAHPGIDVAVATADTQAGLAAGDLYPSLAAAYPDLQLTTFDPSAVDGLDVVFLGLPHEASMDLAPLSGDLASADLAADPDEVIPAISALRVFRGYAGWGPGQLEGEIEAGAWLVLDPDPTDLFTQEPDDLWRVVLRRQPGRLAWLAEAPDDLSAN